MLLALTWKFELIRRNSVVSQQKKACKRESVKAFSELKKGKEPSLM